MKAWLHMPTQAGFSKVGGCYITIFLVISDGYFAGLFEDLLGKDGMISCLFQQKKGLKILWQPCVSLPHTDNNETAQFQTLLKVTYI